MTNIKILTNSIEETKGWIVDCESKLAMILLTGEIAYYRTHNLHGLISHYKEFLKGLQFKLEIARGDNND